MVLCRPYYTLDFIQNGVLQTILYFRLYTKWCSADQLPALYDILSI